MRTPRRRAGAAAVLWTGGKDSALALHEVHARGLPVVALVSFGPVRGRFRAHPIGVQRLQARALGLPHRFLRLRPPYRAAYRRAFRRLRSEGIDTIVTGDLDRVTGCGSWVRSIAGPLGLRVVTPLWHRERRALWRCLDTLGFRVVLSYAAAGRLPAGSIGRRLSGPTVQRLASAAGGRFDLAGENGEFHTWVLDAPLFRRPLELDRRSVGSDDRGCWLRPAGVRLGLSRRGGPPRRSRFEGHSP